MTTGQATINFVTGSLDVEHDGDDSDFVIVNGEPVQTHDDLEPWGEEEYDLDRAVAALKRMGWDVIPNTWRESISDEAVVNISR